MLTNMKGSHRSRFWNSHDIAHRSYGGEQDIGLGISTDFDGFHSALDRKSQVVDIDLVMQKVRVRVSQWLRSQNPDFAKQADDLLKQDVALLAQAATAAQTEKLLSVQSRTSTARC